MSSTADLVSMAREAGAAGIDYMTWTTSDAVSAAVDAYDTAGLSLDTRAYEAAHAEGRRAFLLSGGWKTIWTTAPECYDCFGTETVEHCGQWHGKTLRRVIASPTHANYQADRYGSGLHGTWDEDPRISEARIREQIEQEKREREERTRRREAGLEWLKTADDAQLENLDPWSHGLEWSDVRAEQRRRDDERAAAERAKTRARCREALPEGATVIDLGTRGFQGVYGWIRGREPHAWRSVSVRPSCADDAEAEVVGEGGEVVGSLELVAERLASGEYRLASAEEHVPPRAVVERIGCRFTEILRVEAAGQIVWVGKSPFVYDPIVLDDRGHIVRKAKIRDAALEAFHNQSAA